MRRMAIRRMDMAKIVNSWNEWDPLKRVILGSPVGTCNPYPNISWTNISPTYPKYFGPLPQAWQDVATEQMNAFQAAMEKRGVKVDRPTVLNTLQKTSTPDWECEVMRGCQPPRDVFLPVGNAILESPMALRSRFYEYLHFRPIFEEYFKEDPDFIWLSAPRPRLTNDSFEQGFWESYYGDMWNEDDMQKRALAQHWHLTEKEPLFDAADGLRFGKDIFWQPSVVTNKAGFDWVRRYLKLLGVRVHEARFSRKGGMPWHIDGMLMPLKPGLCMYCPDNGPLIPQMDELFRINDWEMVACAKPVHDIHITVGALAERHGPSWLSANTLSLDPKTICVEINETAYAEQLNKLGFEVVPLHYAETLAFGGSFHCTTVDVFREGGCEDYFPNQVPGF